MLVRYLGPKDYGIYSYSIALVGIFSPFLSFGINELFVREYVKRQMIRSEIFWTGLTIKLVGSISVFIIVNLGSYFSSLSEDIRILIFMISLMGVLKSIDIIDLVFQSEVNLKYVSLILLISIIISNILKYIFILNELNIIYFGLIFVIEGFVQLFLRLYFFLKHNEFPGFILNKQLLYFFYRKSFFLLLSGIFVTIYMRIDQVMIKNTLGDSVLGAYSSAVKLIESIYFIPTILLSSIFPSIINSRKKYFYFQRLKKLLFLLILLSGSISIFTYGFSREIILIFFGKEYLLSIQVLKILIWTSVFIFVSVAINSVLVIEKLEKQILYGTLGGAISNIVLNLILIPKQGLSGAAFASVISYFISTFFIYSLMPKTRSLYLKILKSR